MARASVNRYLKDKIMDHIDHALGRPVDPMVESYRNRFATDADPEFEESPYWKRFAADGDMVFYGVTQEGRRALKSHLETIGDKHRSYRVSVEGYDGSELMAAKSHGEARYLAWIDFSDWNHDCTFGDFMKMSSVRLANKGSA